MNIGSVICVETVEENNKTKKMPQARIVFDIVQDSKKKIRKRSNRVDKKKNSSKKRRSGVAAAAAAEEEEVKVINVEPFLGVLPMPPADLSGIKELEALNWHPLDSTIKFIESTHTYLVQWNVDADTAYKSDGVISVSSVIAEYFPKFDADEVIAKMRRKTGTFSQKGKYAGMTVEQVKAMWVVSGDEARTKGTAYHNSAEAILCGLSVQPGSVYARNPCIRQFLGWFHGEFAASGFEVYRTEMRLRSTAAIRITGMCDFLLVKKDHGIPEETGGILHLTLGDHKRCKALKFSNKWQCGEGPCSHLEDCSFARYSLQGSLYAELLERYYHNARYRGRTYDRIVIDASFLVCVHPDRDAAEVVPLQRHRDVVGEMFDLQSAKIAAL